MLWDRHNSSFAFSLHCSDLFFLSFLFIWDNYLEQQGLNLVFRRIRFFRLRLNFTTFFTLDLSGLVDLGLSGVILAVYLIIITHLTKTLLSVFWLSQNWFNLFLFEPQLINLASQCLNHLLVLSLLLNE
jgi:hypothetical protein